VWRTELRHERHVQAFWNRKLKSGGLTMWLMMGLQLVRMVADLIAIPRRRGELTFVFHPLRAFVPPALDPLGI
jgi:hypothetical protein